MKRLFALVALVWVLVLPSRASDLQTWWEYGDIRSSAPGLTATYSAYLHIL